MKQICVEMVGNSATVSLSKSFDYYSMYGFIKDSESLSECEIIVLDFRNVEYIDSSGIASLFRLREIVKGRDCIRAINLRKGIYDLLLLTGCVELFGEKCFERCQET
ncbi:MAG: STAS domain-containing protein [Magnetococcales bacterium]|nr:STAS domain-containing protein [Magnetococcales bacterium]